MEKGFSDHNLQKNVRLRRALPLRLGALSGDCRLIKMPLRVSMTEAMPASAKYPGYVTAT